MSSQEYNIKLPANLLPPRRPRTINITGDSDTDLIIKYRALAVDVVINNFDAVDGLLTINNESPITLKAGASLSESDVSVWHLTLTGLTKGSIVFHTLDLATLQRFGALEVN